MIDKDYNHKKPMIKRAEEFKKHTYNTLKKTLYNVEKIKKILLVINIYVLIKIDF
jgi:hypothetical protein